MIPPSDETYRRAKRIKLSGIPLESPCKELAEWIASTYGVGVLHVVHKTALQEQPRLTVFVDTTDDLARLEDRGKESRIAITKRFQEIAASHREYHFPTRNLSVTFAAFEATARREACEQVTERELDDFTTRLGREDLWKIYPAADCVTFFFHTDAQAKGNEASGLKDYLAREYTCILQPYDEFGYLKKRPVRVEFYSKEKFDIEYGGDWFFYTR